MYLIPSLIWIPRYVCAGLSESNDSPAKSTLLRGSSVRSLRHSHCCSHSRRIYMHTLINSCRCGRRVRLQSLARAVIRILITCVHTCEPKTGTRPKRYRACNLNIIYECVYVCARVSVLLTLCYESQSINLKRNFNSYGGQFRLHLKAHAGNLRGQLYVFPEIKIDCKYIISNLNCC